jgi:hypothetical protein
MPSPIIPSSSLGRSSNPDRGGEGLLSTEGGMCVASVLSLCENAHPRYLIELAGSSAARMVGGLGSSPRGAFVTSPSRVCFVGHFVEELRRMKVEKVVESVD